MGLFIGQPKAFFDLLQELAADADKAKRKDDGEDYYTGRQPLSQPPRSAEESAPSLAFMESVTTRRGRLLVG